MKKELTEEQIMKQVEIAVNCGNRCEITELFKLLKQLKKQQ